MDWLVARDESGPHLTRIAIGSQGIAFDRFESEWFSAPVAMAGWEHSGQRAAWLMFAC
jgi:hypothetical protein